MVEYYLRSKLSLNSTGSNAHSSLNAVEIMKTTINWLEDINNNWKAAQYELIRQFIFNMEKYIPLITYL